MSMRLYVRSIHRAIINQLKFFISIKDIFSEIFLIVNKKEKIYEKVSLSKEKLQRRRNIINSKSFGVQSKFINFVR